jgi:hypothetical protein
MFVRILLGATVPINFFVKINLSKNGNKLGSLNNKSPTRNYVLRFWNFAQINNFFENTAVC